MEEQTVLPAELSWGSVLLIAIEILTACFLAVEMQSQISTMGGEVPL